jgi:hypothetical protein
MSGSVVTNLPELAREVAAASMLDGQLEPDLVQYAMGVVTRLAAKYKSAAAVRMLAVAVCASVHPASGDMPCAPEHLQYGEAPTGGTPMNTRWADELLAKMLTDDLVESA